MNSKERLIFDCIDAHTQGNPVRLVKGPKPELKGSSMGEKRIHFINEFDWIRTGLMFEPHGHDMMSGSFFYEPDNKKNDLAILLFIRRLSVAPQMPVLLILPFTTTDTDFSKLANSST